MILFDPTVNLQTPRTLFFSKCSLFNICASILCYALKMQFLDPTSDHLNGFSEGVVQDCIFNSSPWWPLCILMVSRTRVLHLWLCHRHLGSQGKPVNQNAMFKCRESNIQDDKENWLDWKTMIKISNKNKFLINKCWSFVSNAFITRSHNYKSFEEIMSINDVLR